jgi:Flp pilus assembly protein TadD
MLLLSCGTGPATAPPARTGPPTGRARAPAKVPSAPGRAAAGESAGQEDNPARREADRLAALAEQEERTKDPELLLALGVARAKAGDLSEAAHQFRRVARMRPKDFRPPYNLGLVLLQMGRPGEAVGALESAQRLGPRQVEVLVDLGIARRKAGDAHGSVRTLRQATALTSRHPRAHLNLGLSLEAAGQSGAALEAYRQAAALDPRLRRAHLRMGALLHERKNHKAAVAALQRALALGEDDVETRARLGVVLLESGEPAAAAPHLARAAAAKPDGGLQLNLGLALERTRDLAGAQSAYQRAVELLPGSAEAHLRLAIVQARLGASSEARRTAARSLQLDRRLRPALDQVIHELAKSSSLDAAVALVDAILAVMPEDRVASHNRRALEQMRRRRTSP